MKITVVGIGQVGGVLAIHLIKAKHQVQLVDIDQNLISWSLKHGLLCKKDKGEIKVEHQQFKAFTDFSQTEPAEVVFVCVKTNVVDKVACQLAKSWSADSYVVSFQNGIDPEEILAQKFGRDKTLRIVVNFAGNMESVGVYQVNWFNPPNYIGGLTQEGNLKAKELASIITQAGLESKSVEDIKVQAFEKTALNAPLCPICALTGLTMGETMNYGPTRDLVVEVLKETRMVGEKMGLVFEKSIDDWMGYLEKGGAHKPSMSVDIENCLKTEIEFINGKVCEYGNKLNIPTPYNKAMRCSILGKEHLLTSL